MEADGTLSTAAAAALKLGGEAVGEWRAPRRASAVLTARPLGVHPPSQRGGSSRQQNMARCLQGQAVQTLDYNINAEMFQTCQYLSGAAAMESADHLSNH